MYIYIYIYIYKYIYIYMCVLIYTTNHRFTRVFANSIVMICNTF